MTAAALVLLLTLGAPADELKGAIKAEKASKLPAAAKKELARDGAVVVEGRERHFFALYDRNTYLGIPSFVSVDVLLHVFHVRFDALLSRAERERAMPELLAFATDQMNRALALLPKSGTPERRLQLLAAYHAVPYALLSRTSDVDPRIQDDVKAELERIMGAAGIAPSPLCARPIDYSLLKPRGHYDRAAEYFRAFSFYALCGMDLSTPEGTARAVDVYRLLDPSAREKLARVKSFLELIAGRPDDPGIEALESIIGKDAPALPAALSQQALASIIAKAKTLPRAQVPQQTSTQPAAPILYMLGLAGTPDSALLGTTVSAKRPFPSVLDVLTALGSSAAGKLGGISEHGLPLGTSIYDAWLAILGNVIRAPAVTAPTYAQSDVFVKRLLSSAAGSWTELRHDTILYVKQPIVMAQGGHSAELPSSKWAGYIEPNLDVYRGLDRLLDRIAATIGSEQPDPQVTALKELIGFAIKVTQLELANEPFPKEVDERLRVIGTELEELTRGHADELPDMALAADFFTSVQPEGGARVLHAAIGDVDELWVVVPRGGKKLLTRGGVYAYYELIEPARLNDRDWIDRLRSKQKPARPGWSAVSSTAPVRKKD